jgi:hypothetical protein
MGSNLADPRRASDAQTRGQPCDDPHEELRRGALVVQERARGVAEVSLAADALKLAPGLAAGLAIGAEIASTSPALVGAIRLWTDVRVRVDHPSATAGEGEHGRRRARRLGTFVGFLLTGRAERCVEKAGEGCGLFGALTSALVGFQGRLGEELVGPPAMNEEADEDESNHEELVKQQVWCHNDVPSHDGDRRRLYRISPLTYYP